jgi:hypothetical protein
MKKIYPRIVTILYLIFGLMCATAPRIAAANSSTESLKQVRRGALSVLVGGLGGAVIGISTLSFYKNSHEHIGNVTTGFGVGLVAGTIFLLASQPHQSPYNFEGNTPRVIEESNYHPRGKSISQTGDALPLLSMNFRF